MNKIGMLKGSGFLLITILLIVQATLIPLVTIAGVAPDLLLIGLVFWSGSRKRWEGALYGFICGLLQDLTLGDTVGLFAFSKTIAGFISSAYPWFPRERNPLIAGVVIFIAGIVHQTAAYLYTAVETAGGLLLMLRYGLPSLLYSICIGLLFLAVSNLWARFFRRPDHS